MVAAIMVLYTSATATLIYALFKLLPWDYALFFFLWAALWTAVGQSALELLLKRYRMASFTVLAIGVTIVLSVLVYVGHAIRDFALHPHAAIAVPDFCPSGGGGGHTSTGAAGR